MVARFFFSIFLQQHTSLKAAHQIWFINVWGIVGLELVVKACIYELIEVEKAGLKVNFKTNTEPTISEVFQHKSVKMSALKTAFNALIPERQRV